MLADSGTLKKMKWLSGVVVVYGLFCIGAGVEAYLAKNSLPSLLGGGGIGLLALIGAFVATKNGPIGFGIAAVAALAALGRFLPAYLKTQSVWPALVMVLASSVVLACLIAGHLQNRRLS